MQRQKKFAALGFASVLESGETSARVRRSSLRSVSAVFVSAAKTAHPLPPSSFPMQTRFAGLCIGLESGEPAAETWEAGDEVRIYYKPNAKHQALRFMNITQTNIFKK